MIFVTNNVLCHFISCITKQKQKHIDIDQTYQMSTFSDTGSFLITSGAIQATVPANDILVLFSLSSLEVPKSEIFTRSSCVISILEKTGQHEINTLGHGVFNFSK